MEHIINGNTATGFSSDTETLVSNSSYQTYQILRPGFIVAPIVAGLDKFFHLLVNWDQYLPSSINNLTGGYGHELMLAAGVIEIVAGLGVAQRSGKLRSLVWPLFFDHTHTKLNAGRGGSMRWQRKSPN
jgi:hypothetical protein